MTSKNVPKHVPLLHPIHFFSLGLGSGLSSFMPGTMGSLCAVLIWICFSQIITVSLSLYIIIITLTFIMGVYFCDYTSRAMQSHDHGSIVWDEFVGMWITLAFLPAGSHWLWIIGAFCLFRFFDITKIWPINWCDRNVKGGLGVMLDDVVAGILAGGVLFLIISCVS